MTDSHVTSRASPAATIPRSVWVLGFVSLFMDVSSELIHSLLPVFMVTSLGATMLMVGVVEGVAEATALIVKVFSGTISDHLGKRKGLAVLGYGLGAVSKPIFALALSVHWVFAARFMDRIGKGIRGAPRDALVADLTAPEIRGAAYGLRQSLDTVGAFVGPLLAVALMLLWAGDFRAVFWFAVVPGVVSVLILVVGVQEPGTAAGKRTAVSPIRWQTLGELGRAYWWVVAAGGVFTLARFSEAFLILRAQQLGLADAYVPLVLVLMNVVYALSAYPMGRLADRMSHHALLCAGLGVLVVSDLVLALAQGLGMVALGVALWGLHMGMTQGLLATMVAGAAPAQLRGTAFGFFNLVSGVAMLIASVLAGLLWDKLGAAVTFYCGAAFSIVALMMLGPRRRQ
ncbi:MAG: MFS transporter [Betaproteobacteria bacterium RIFCSPLOWO2_12_FULL_62_13]|nr:MAG: MFS transporter [Betaproteobacteria bacterium RIFCSPLOWO2_12_FULL_62_13]